MLKFREVGRAACHVRWFWCLRGSAMDEDLVAEIVGSDCWEGPIAATMRCILLDGAPTRAEDNVEGDRGVLMMTATMLYVMQQVGADDAAVVFEDVTEAALSLLIRRLDCGRIALELVTADGPVHFAPPNEDDAWSESDVTQLLRQHVPSLAVRVSDLSGLEGTQTVAISGALQSVVQSLRDDAAAAETQLRGERARLATMLTAATATAGFEALELAEADARSATVNEWWLEFTHVLHASFMHRVTTLESDCMVTVQDVKKQHCTTLSLSSILPDGAMTGNLIEQPSCDDVVKMIETVEKATRARMDSYLTTQQLDGRERRKRLELEAAMRQHTTREAKWATERAELVAEVARLSAHCKDIESSCAAMATQLSDVQTRERAVIERARRREEELHSQLRKFHATDVDNVSRGGSAAPAASARRARSTSAANNAPVFDFMARR